MAVSATSSRARYRSFRQLDVWQLAMALTVAVHKLAGSLPEFERYELARDLRKTARSLPANIAEGFNRHSRAAYRSHIAIALGSQAELDTQIELAVRLEYLTSKDVEAVVRMIESTGQMLQALWRALGETGG